MKLVHFIRRELTISSRFLILIAGIAALSNALIVVIINAAAGQVSERTSNLSYLIWFAIVITIYIIAQRYLLITTSNAVDQSLNKTRLRIISKIQSSEVLTLDRIGRAEIFSCISKDMQTISDSSIMLTVMFQSAIFVVFALIYIAMQSKIALLLYIVFVGISIFIYLRRNRVLMKTMHEAMSRENEMYERLTHLLDGFKEVKMSELRQADLNEHISDISNSVVKLKADAKRLLAGMNVFSQAVLYFLLGAVVFILPLIVSLHTGEMAKLTATMLFLMAPLGALVGGVQQYATATVAAENIENLEAAINRHVRPMARRRAESLIIRAEPFRTLTFDQVQFSYGDGEVPFELGPLDLSISPGETIFITGGNGSGKTTFLRLLTCLYFPTSGELRLDGQRLSETNAASYRNLFSAIFYDYHLFDYLYGLRNVDAQRVDELLEKLQLHDKTRLVDNRFETLNLSSGQRRRLALLINYLENKPICVFDEWAAEQDPQYRRYFYTDILPELKAQGKTLIVVTHDDRYYEMDYIDRILRFEEGRLI